MLDLPEFTKFEVSGPGAHAWLDHMVAGTVPRPGRTALNRFVPLIVAAEDADAAAVSIVYRKDEVVGLVTSGGFGYRLRQSIALAYVRTDLAAAGTELEVEILGTRRRAVVGTEPLYDPQNLRLRG